MIKLKKQFNDKAVPFIDCMDEKSLAVLNSVLLQLDPRRKPYTIKSVRKKIKVARAEKKSSFWKKLMQERKAVGQ